MNWSASMKGTFSNTSSGVTSSASMPHAFALDMRRRSSSIRSSVRAISKPPDCVKTPISLYCLTESRVRSVISREWSTVKMKLEAWPVEPPGLGRAPLSIWTTFFQPSLRQVVDQAVADDPGADHDDVGGCGHLCHDYLLLRNAQRVALCASMWKCIAAVPGHCQGAGDGG